jgi:hypothetical protein
MKVQFTCLVLFLALTGILASCKKDKDDKKPVCRIVRIIDSGMRTNMYNITYNNDGRISTLHSSGASVTNKVFTYSGNTININTTVGSNTFSSRDSITLDNKRRPVNIRSFFNESGTNWSNFSLEYNGDDLLKYTVTTSSSSPPETVTATYVNGNMVNLQTAGTSLTFEYFTDKLVQPGDYLEIANLIQYGATIYPHKNLVKSAISNGGAITNFNYEFNTDGQITKLIATSSGSGSSVNTLSYQYQCN